MNTILTVFGTRPEAIKLVPVIREIGKRSDMRSVTVCSSQHTDLLVPFVRQLDIPVDHDLKVMTTGQSPTDVLAKVIAGMQDLLRKIRPSMVLVQGDTTTALAGALAASYEKVLVGHVEAGLRTGDRLSPFPEELNRRLIAQASDMHFAATPANADSLRDENIASCDIFCTGNTVVDSLNHIQMNFNPSDALTNLIDQLSGMRIIAMTTHRRENFGGVMRGHMQCVREFVSRHDDVAVIFPVHPNPNVSEAAFHELNGRERIHLVEPLEYADFIYLLSRAWLIVSDSGGVVEEAPTLGKPVLVLRDTTERHEAVDCGVAKLAGHDTDRLNELLEEAIASDKWVKTAADATNPFGSGDASKRIVSAIQTRFGTYVRSRDPLPSVVANR